MVTDAIPSFAFSLPALVPLVAGVLVLARANWPEGPRLLVGASLLVMTVAWPLAVAL